MNAVPTKIVLKSTTRMSLNDRFSTITPSLQNIRANVQAEHQVSAANRRLAQQLANRPGVQPGPGIYQQAPRGARRGSFQQQNLQQNNRNLAQRLGTPNNSAGNIKSRLTLPRGHPQRGGGGRGRGQAYQGGDNQLSQRGRGGYNFRGQQTRGAGRGRGGMQRGRGAGNPQVLSQNNYSAGSNRGQGRGRGRGMQRGARGGRGRGGRGGNSNTKVTQSDLDSQLDQYMSKTKSSLDSELDSYMAEANV